MKIRRCNTDDRGGDFLMRVVIQNFELSSDDIRRATVALSPETVVQDDRPARARTTPYIVVRCDQPANIRPDAHQVERGVDGITFLDGVLYVNKVVFNKLYRIPVDASGKPGAPVDIWIDQPIKGPDGMRAANGKLFVAENGSGKISAITVNGDKASLTVLKDGLNTPTGIEPAGDTIWITERGAGKVWSLPMPKVLTKEFRPHREALFTRGAKPQWGRGGTRGGRGGSSRGRRWREENGDADEGDRVVGADAVEDAGEDLGNGGGDDDADRGRR